MAASHFYLLDILRLFILAFVISQQGLPRGREVKNLPASAGGPGDVGSITGSRRSPGIGNGRSLESCSPKGLKALDPNEHNLRRCNFALNTMALL